MKNAQKFIVAALTSCMILSLTATAQTSEDFTEDGECVTDEMPNGMIPWYDVLGISVEQLREEMAQNSVEIISENTSQNSSCENIDFSSLTPEEQGEYLNSLTPNELSSLLVYDIDYEPLSPEEQIAFEIECPQKHTPEESKEIRKRLTAVKHPDDLICSDHGEIYLDISWRDKNATIDTNCTQEEFTQFGGDFTVSPATIIDVTIE